jgi:hypothetical protein
MACKPLATVRAALSGKIERLIARSVQGQLDLVTAQIAELAGTTARLERLVAEMRAPLVTETNQRLATIETALPDLRERLVRVREISSATLDDIPALRRQLRTVRSEADYERSFARSDPLVTVRIATYNRSGPLVERALASVLRQSYQNFEVVVVGDGCTDNTAERLDQLGDPRIRFVNLPYRYPYPDDPTKRWLVAGSPAMNVGAQLAEGAWIAPLDDDDEFEDDHIEVLLSEALENRYELVYGRILQVRPPPAENYLHGRYPPELAEFGFQGAIYLTALRIFEYNPKSWMLDEPGDWNLCRRMLEAGVRIGWRDRVVSRYYPSQLTPRPGAADAEPSSAAPRLRAGAGW